MTKEKKLIFGIGISKRVDIIETALELGIIEQRGSFFVVDSLDLKIKGRKALYDQPNDVMAKIQDLLKSKKESEG